VGLVGVAKETFRDCWELDACVLSSPIATDLSRTTRDVPANLVKAAECI
jgi:hypothetical protein